MGKTNEQVGDWYANRPKIPPEAWKVKWTSDPWPFSENDMLERAATWDLIDAGTAGLTDDEATAQRPSIKALDEALKLDAWALMMTLEERLNKLDNRRLFELLKKIQDTCRYSDSFSAPVRVEDGIAYVTGAVNLPVLLGKPSDDELRERHVTRDWKAYFRCRHALQSFGNDWLAANGWLPRPDRISEYPWGFLELKKDAGWESRIEFSVTYSFDAPHARWPDDILERKHMVFDEWRPMEGRAEKMAEVLVRLACGKLFA